MSRIENKESRNIETRELRVEDRGWRIEDREAGSEDRGSRIEN